MMDDTKEALKHLIFTIRIDGEEWKEIQPTEKFDKDRIDLRLNDPWTDVLSTKIWEARKLPCAFAFKRQKFYKLDKYPYFTFYGKCNSKNCANEINGKCLKPDADGVNIDIECFDTLCIPHKNKRPLAGKTREIAKKDLRSIKPTKYKQNKANKFLNDSGGSCPLLQNTQVFCTARQEVKDEVLGLEQYPGDPVTSVMAIMNDVSYIKEFSTVPFYIWYWTDNQMALWVEAHEVLKASMSIDASGCFVKEIKLYNDNRSSAIFLYNAVIRINNKIFTVTQALSDIHDTNAIFLWLFSWLRSGAPIPTEVIVDCSSALLNAVSLAFNSMFYTNYLQTCFDILNEKKIAIPQCLIKRDRAHLIKALSKWKCFDNDNWIKKDFLIRCIAYSLEIYDIQLLIEVMTAIFIVLESKYSDENTECFRRKTWLTKKIATFNYDKFYNDEENEDEKEEFEKDYSYINEELESLNVEALPDFVHKIYNDCLRICSTESKTCNEPNSYYLPSASKNLLSLYSQFPAWTNIMNKYFHFSSNVATSTASECYFRIMRRDYNMSGPISLNRFLLDHVNNINGATKLGRTMIKLVKNQKTHNLKCNEESIKLNGLSVQKTVDSTNDDKLSNNQHINNMKATNKTVLNIQSTLQCNNIGKANLSNNINDTKLLLKNETARHYMQQVSIAYTVALFDCTKIPENIFSYRNVKSHLILWNESFLSLKTPNHIEGNIVDSFMIMKSTKDWKDVSFIPTCHTNYILGYSKNTDKPNTWLMYNIEFHFFGLIFLPYCYDEHWCLLVLNVEDATIMHLDPLTYYDTGDCAVEAFQKYLSGCNETNNLTQIQWRRVRFNEERTIQKDGYNCGILILFYMDCLAQKKSLKDINFDADVLRIKLIEDIFRYSEDIKKVCLFCTKNKDSIDASNYRTCRICQRWAHLTCLSRNTETLEKEDPLYTFEICILCYS